MSAAPGFPASHPWARWRCLAALLSIFLAGVSGRAHVADTSYCKIDIGERRVTFTFTFDFATLLRVAPVDANGDNRITREELLTATPAIEAFLRRNVYIEINERVSYFGALEDPPWSPDAGEAIPASAYVTRLATFSFHNSLLHPPDAVAIIFDFFNIVGERHTVLGSFVWNRQENPVNFTAHEPDYLFDTGYRVPALDQFKQYLWLGVSHIFLGFDHIAFLLALFFVPRFLDLAKIITAFTVAHTLTLVSAALGAISLPDRLVESAIAASIVYVAGENLFRQPDSGHRWRLTFAFGLVHGFGFAGVLKGLGLPSEGLALCLLSFNLGVELGQLAIAAVCWPLLLWAGRQPWSARLRVAVSAVLFAFGLAWVIDRAFSLKWMPF